MACLWKINLFKKYDYCCAKCGCTVNLSLHHLFSQSKYPQFKTLLANQIVLCEQCHQRYHYKFLKRDIDKCNPITFLQWVGDGFANNGYKCKPNYLVRIDKHYKESYNRVFKDDGSEVEWMDLFKHTYISTMTYKMIVNNFLIMIGDAKSEMEK